MEGQTPKIEVYEHRASTLYDTGVEGRGTDRMSSMCQHDDFGIQFFSQYYNLMKKRERTSVAYTGTLVWCYRHCPSRSLNLMSDTVLDEASS